MATILKEPNIIRNSMSKKSYAWKSDFLLIKFIRIVLIRRTILINTILLHFHLIPALVCIDSWSSNHLSDGQCIGVLTTVENFTLLRFGRPSGIKVELQWNALRFSFGYSSPLFGWTELKVADCSYILLWLLLQNVKLVDKWWITTVCHLITFLILLGHQVYSSSFFSSWR